MESFFWCFYIPCCLYLVESFFFRFFNAHLVGTYFCYFHITCGLYFSAILLPLFVAGDLRNLVPAVFALHLLLTLQEFFLLFVQCTREVPYKILFLLLLHVACTQRNPYIAAFHCMCLAHCEIMLLLVKHSMMLTLCSLQNPCSAVLTLHAAHTFISSVSVVFTLHLALLSNI